MTAVFDRTIPLLAYDDIPAAHDFLVDVFGFEPGGGQREYGVRDLEGHRWWLAAPVEG